MNVSHIILKFTCFSNNKHFLWLLIFTCFAFNIRGQDITQPVLNGNLRCDSPLERSVSMVSAVFTSTAGVNSSVFQLELSNKNGLFNTGTLILSVEAEISGSQIFFNDFLLPEIDGTNTTLGSENYRLRIITTDNSFADSSPSDAFAAYFAEIIRPSLSPAGTLCSIPEFLTAEADFDEYVWFRNGILIEGESSNILPISTVGQYYYFPNLGSCRPNLDEAQSNVVTVLEAETIDVEISIQGSASLCASETRVLSTDITDPNISFIWTLDGVRIPGANESTFEVTGIDAEGTYNLQVFDNTLLAGDRCTSISNSIDIDLLNPSIEIISDLTVFLIPGVEQIAEVETTGQDQVITWIFNGDDIADSNSNTFVLSQPGVYTARLEATSSCDDNGPFTTIDSITVTSPSNISSIIDYNNPAYEDCELDQIILEIIDITFESGSEEVTIPQENYQFLDFEWIRNSTETGEVDDSILIDRPEDSGDYFLRITFGGVAFDSAPLPVLLNAGSLEIQRSSEDFVFGSSIDLFVELDEDAIVSDFQFQWLVAGQVLTGETGPSITITNGGSYSVQVIYLDCDATLIGPIDINSGSAVIPNVITLNGDGINDDWILTNEFTNQPNVEVNIFTSSGDLDFSSVNYNGEWPENSESRAIGTVYYYVISRDNSAVEKGSITIIR